MTNSLATLALALLLAGTTAAQEKQSKRSTGKKSSTGAMSATDASRSNSSASTTQDGSNGAPVGTGLTNDQYQGAKNSTNGPAKVDANSSIRTGPSAVKARKKSPKDGN